MALVFQGWVTWPSARTPLAIEDAVERFEAGCWQLLVVAFALFGAAGRRASTAIARGGGWGRVLEWGGGRRSAVFEPPQGHPGGTPRRGISTRRAASDRGASPMSADVVRANVQRRKSDDSPAFKLVGRVTTSH